MPQCQALTKNKEQCLKEAVIEDLCLVHFKMATGQNNIERKYIKEPVRWEY